MEESDLRKVISVLIILFSIVFATGCTQPSTPGQTPTPVVSPTATPAATQTATTAATATEQETGTQTGASGQEIEVSIRGFAFSPQTVTISRGDTVTWTNQDSTVHTVSVEGEVSPGLSKGESFSHIFDEEGTFDYICSIHPAMKGTVIVE